MKIDGLLRLITDKKLTDLPEDQANEVLVKKLEVREYLSIKEKRGIINEILDDSSTVENGIVKFDEIKRYILLVMYTINAYTNLELSDDVEADYDTLCSSGALVRVVNLFYDEYQCIDGLLQLEYEARLQNNSVEAQVSRLVTKVTDALDGLNGFIEQMGKFATPEGMQELESLLKTLG